MSEFLKQAQLFVDSAALMAVGFALLYYALGLYGLCLDRAIAALGISAAFREFVKQRLKQNAWWYRLSKWYDRTYKGLDY